MKRNAEQSTKSPHPVVLALISQFLSKHGFSSTLRIFTTERRKRLSSQKATSTYGARETAGVPSLEVIVSNHLKKNPPPVRSEPAAYETDSDESSSSSGRDSDSSDGDSASGEDVKMGSATDSESDSSEFDSDENTPAAALVPAASRKRKAAASSSSDSDATSDSSSSESEQEPPAKKAKINAKASTASISHKSVSSSSSSSSGGGGCDSESSASESDSSSEGSDDEDTAAKVVNEDLNNAVTTPLPPSDSSSSEDDEASDSSSSSNSGGSGDESDSESESDAENTPPPPVKPTKPVTNADETSDSSGTIVGDQPTAGYSATRQSKHQGAHPTRLAMLSATADMDEYVSNTYVSYDYADRAYKDLSVTRGKGFTKEKNKKKRGSYRGGTIDTAGGKAFKFDD